MTMKKYIVKITALVMVLAVLISGVSLYVSAGESTWQLDEENTSIYWVNTSSYDDKALQAQVKLFSEELQANGITAGCLPIYYGSSENAGDCDIVLNLDNTFSNIPAQGYSVEVDGGALHVKASDADGLFYGCRYVIKQMKANGEVTSEAASPAVLERGISLDNGRKYYSVDWIKQMIRELSWANMNTLVLHFSEEMGWGIESKLYPWLAGRDGELCTQAEVATDNTCLTQDEVKEIVEYAKLYHVEIIPSIDSPGHLNYLVKKFNEKCATSAYSFTYNGRTYTAEAGSEIGNYYHYNGKTSIVKGSRNAEYSRGIDISNEVAVAFVHSLIEEYGKLFNDLGCTKFDIGGDELLGWGSAIVSSVNKWQQLDHWKTYAQNRAQAEGLSNYASAVAYDGFMYYMNDLNALVRSLGYTSVRMWNDDALRSSDTGWNKVVELNTNIDIWYWDDSKNTVSTYTSAGHKVYNILSDYNYYAMTSNYFSNDRSSFAEAYADKIYEEWTPYTFGSQDLSNGDSNVLGSAFGIWSDNPSLRTEAQVMEEVLPMLRAHGAKAWDATCNKKVSYSDFVAAQDVVGKYALKSVIDKYDAADISGIYTEETFNAYKEAVDAGKAIFEDVNADQNAVNAAVAAIEKARNALEYRADYCHIESASFQTTRVRIGGKAVLKVVVSGTPEKFTLKDENGNAITNFSIIKSSEVNYLQFTVEGNPGWTSYTVTVNDNSAGAVSADLRLWKPAH